MREAIWRTEIDRGEIMKAKSEKADGSKKGSTSIKGEGEGNEMQVMMSRLNEGSRAQENKAVNSEGKQRERSRN